MSDLIERLEKATGPDRELDGDIAHVLGLAPVDFERQDRGWLWIKYLRGSTPDFDSWEAPEFTKSIDAALTILPPQIQFQWTIEQDAAWVRWLIGEDVKEAQGYYFRCEGGMTAAAFALAALRARAALHQEREP